MLCYVCLESAEAEWLSDSLRRVDCPTCGSYVVDRADAYALNDAGLGAWRAALHDAKFRADAGALPAVRSGRPQDWPLSTAVQRPA
jgi:hypothetical protein